jgi:hypothetical protein
MNDIVTKPAKIRKPNVGSDPTKGARVRRWQAGFYAFAIGVSTVMIGLSLFYTLTGRFSRLLTAAAVLVAGLSWGLLTAKNDAFKEPDGIKVDAVEAALTSFVQQVADQVGAPMPDAIYLVTTADFHITESTRYFGRKVDKSVLAIGLPYLQSMTRQELAALLAHELGHYVDVGIEEGVRAQRSLRAARDLIWIERQGPINGVYGSYARKMFRSIGGVGEAQEEAADRVAVMSYGTAALLSALHKLDDTAVAFDQMLREYVVPALQNQMHPDDMFGGFGELLASRTRAEERERDVERRRAKERNEFELHLTASERTARVESWSTESARVTVERADEGAHTLLDPEAKSVKIAVGSWAKKLMTHRTEPQSWEQLVEQVYSVKTQSLASMVFDDEIPADDQLERAFVWSANGEWAQVDGSMEACLKSIKDSTERRTKWARCVVVEAAAATGGYSWQHSWDGPPVLVDETGDSLDAIGIAAMIADGDAAMARSTFDAATMNR